MRSGAVDFIQLNYSVAEREAEQRLLPLARDSQVAVIANRPFAGGELFSTIRRKPLPAWAAELRCTSWAQLMLKYVLSDSASPAQFPAPATRVTCSTTWELQSRRCRMRRCVDGSCRQHLAD